MPTFLTSTPVPLGGTEVIGDIVGIVPSLLSLVTKFPINIVLASGLIGIAFVIVRKAKGSARVK